MEIEWLGQDSETLAHTSKLTIRGRATTTPRAAEIGQAKPKPSEVSEVIGPHHTLTKNEEEKLKVRPPSKNALVLAGESLAYETVLNVGYREPATDALLGRLKAKMAEDRINLVYTRIPGLFQRDEGKIPAPPIDDLRASALADIQLEAGASLIIPPVPTNLQAIRQFERVLERTTVSIQTFDESRELVGHIPTTDRLDLVRDMVATYVKKGVHFFSVDFSGASNRPAMMRTIVRTIRENMKIKKKAQEKDERYYLHVFNASAAKKSVLDVTPVSDIIVHPYGVDSTSGVMWGGGTLDVDKLRYYNVADYGSYRRKAIVQKGTACTCPVCSAYTVQELYSASPGTVQDRLKTHRAFAYASECGRISERIAAGEVKDSYAPYLMTKSEAAQDLAKILQDVTEVKASL